MSSLRFLSSSSLLTNGFDQDPAYIVSLTLLILLLGLEILFNSGLLLYYLVQVAIRSKTTSGKILSALIIASHLIIKGVHIFPVILLIFPSARNRLIGPQFDDVFFGITITLFIINAIMVLTPVLYGFIMSRTKNWSYVRTEGTSHLSVKRSVADEFNNILPLVLVIMPVYNELPEVLHQAVTSTLASTYPKELLHVFLAFDDDCITTSYVQCCTRLGIYVTPGKNTYAHIIHTEFDGMRLSACRFNHSGKRNTQKSAYLEIMKLYKGSPRENLLNNAVLIFLDSDIVLDKFAIFNFVAAMHEEKYEAMTGLISCKIPEKFNLLWFLQDVEYFHGQMYYRNYQSLLGSITCLPGALTCIRLSLFQTVCSSYFEAEGFGSGDFMEMHRCYLGEDRFLTHLIMEETKSSHAIGFCHDAFCLTEAPDKWRDLLLQRRRWYLGTYMLWLKHPLLMLNELINSSRSTGALIYLVYIYLPLQFSPAYAAILFLIWPFFLIWAIIGADAVIVKRQMMILSYPLIYLIQPLFSWLVTVYATLTLTSIGWGGPRVEGNAEINYDLSSIQEELTIVGQGRPFSNYTNTTAASRDVNATARIPPPVIPSRLGKQYNNSSDASVYSTSFSNESSSTGFQYDAPPLQLSEVSDSSHPHHHHRRQSTRKRKTTASLNPSATTVEETSDYESQDNIPQQLEADRPVSVAHIKSEDHIKTSDLLLSVYNEYRQE